jgi:UDP-N-acetylglucosamine:LPS N-acetylglucosamine transferase
MLPAAARPRRALILTAPVGDGHLAAAQALAEDFESQYPDVEVEVADVLAVFGPVLRFLLLDAYRAQLRRAPWIFGLLFRAFLGVRPLRALGRLGLAALGGRRLERFVRGRDADLVVSTYPAATSVLGYLRRRGRVGGIAGATITDFGGVCFWAHPGIDLHLVMHERLVAEVEREAGAGSAQMTRPLVARAFLQPADGAAVRRELGIPDDARVVVVSGGGWGVGDLAAATRATLTVADSYVIAVAGRNDALERDLRSEFDGDSCVCVLGFTSRMSDLLAAADALVHTTGGVTCLEAIARGCPIVSYGARAGHVPTVSQAMHSLGIATHVRSPAELRQALEDVLAVGAGRVAVEFSSAPSPAGVLLGARARRPARPVRRGARRAVVVLAAAAAGAAFAASSDSAYALVADELDLAPASTLGSAGPEVGLIVEAPARMLAPVARTIARAGGRASFAFSAAPSRSTQRVLQERGDTLVPSLSSAGFLGWVTTVDHLRDAEASVRAIGIAYCLAPSSGLTAGQYLLARVAGLSVISGSLNVRARSVLPAAIGRGAIVVVHLQPGAAGSRLLLALLAQLRRERLQASPLSP